MKTELIVEGMSCSSCVRHVGGAVRKLSGIAHVDVQLREGKVVVEHHPEVTTEEMVEAIQEAGYDARST